MINASAASVFNFLTNIDSMYKVWHPKDHRFCKVIRGKLNKVGSVFHALEILDGFPLYLILKLVKVDHNHYLEYRAVFPFSLLKLGYGYFKIQPLSPNRVKLTAFVQYGLQPAAFDGIANFVVKAETARKHIREEGENMKQYLEQKI